MLSVLLVVALVALLTCNWFVHLRALPPGPILPLPILRHLWWSRFYRKNDMDIILTLRREYEGGIFSVNLGYRRVTIMSDFEKVQACSLHFISKVPKNNYAKLSVAENFCQKSQQTPRR